MKVEIIGSDGGVGPGFHATSYLIDDHLLIDAGSCASNLALERQKAIDHIVISHAHLDHIKDLAFLCDNCFGQREAPFAVYTNPTVRRSIQNHLLNDDIWPDFTQLPSPENPIMQFHDLEIGVKAQIGGHSVLPVLVNHPGEAMGVVIEKEGKSLVFTQDTGPTDKIWQAAAQAPGLCGIFTEVSFPDEMQAVATASQHHTPQTLQAELKKMPAGIPLYIGHLKPGLQQKLFEQLGACAWEERKLSILGRDGRHFSF